MVIDTHSQLWTREAIEGFPPAMADGYKAMFRNIGFPSIEDTIKDMDESGVERSVVVGIDAETTFQYRVSNDLVADTVRLYPDRLIGFAGVDPHKGEQALKELERAVKILGLRGLKLLPHLAELYPNDRAMYPLYETALSLDIPVLFHMGTQFHSGTRIKYCRPLFVDDIAVDFPGLKIVIAHFGFPWFHEAIAVVQRNINVFFNIAGWAPLYIPSDVIMNIKGPLKTKALFGSDYPLVKRVRIMQELRELNIPADISTLLLSENPKRVLGIE